MMRILSSERLKILAGSKIASCAAVAARKSKLAVQTILFQLLL
jgi:hypothetical protein